MIRKSPAILPGKELGEAHFKALPAAKLTARALLREINPLISWGEQQGWLKAEEGKMAREALSKKDAGPLWAKARTWQARLSAKEERHGPPGAGWMLLYSLRKAQKLAKGYEAPYPRLIGRAGKELTQEVACALELEKALGVSCGIEGSAERVRRHFLGLMLVLEKEEATAKHERGVGIWDEIRKENLGTALHQTKGSPGIGGVQWGQWILCPSHGIPAGKPGQWVFPEDKKVREASERLFKKLAWNKAVWENRLGVSLSV